MDWTKLDPSTLSPAVLQRIQGVLTSFFGVWYPGRYIMSAALTLLMWDMVLTIEEEVKFIWPAKWNTVKIMWMWNRYCVPIVLIVHLAGSVRVSWISTNQDCLAWFVSMCAMYIITFVSTNWLMVLTVTTLYHGMPRLQLAVKATFVLTYLVIIALTTMTWVEVGSSVEYNPMMFCILADDGPHLRYNVINYALYATLDSILFILTIVRTVQVQLDVGWDTRNLMFTLFRDGIVRFAVIIGCRIFALLVYACNWQLLLTLVWISTWAIMSMLFSRVFLSMRKAARPSGRGHTTIVSIWTAKPEPALPTDNKHAVDEDGSQPKAIFDIPLKDYANSKDDLEESKNGDGSSVNALI